MKRIWLLAMLACAPFQNMPAHQPDQEQSALTQEGEAHDDLIAFISELSPEEKVALIDHLVSEHQAVISRGAPLPTSLQSVTTKKESSHNQKSHSSGMEPARRKFTTLTIAPNATSACFLPEVFSPNIEGRAFMIQSGALGGLTWVLFALVADMIMMRNTPPSERANRQLTANLVGIGGGALLGLSFAVSNYFALKKSFIKNEDEEVLQFIQKRWKDLRGELIWPQHVVSILDYLQRKSTRGTFDLEEAKQCIRALREPGRVT